MGHKIVVDESKCIGCGACSATCSGSFVLKGGKAYPIKAEVEEITCEEDAESGCPVGAISIG